MSSLPLPLLLLIHLHILQFPQVNEPQYDMNLFDSSHRGLKDRTKSMEDVCYFLVECSEKSRTSAKKILATYPCSKPSDSPIFRASLAKYLENLRQNALKPKVSSSQSQVNGSSEATWWKDVVVRKSLLEECTGDKFMKVIVAFSTHILYTRSIGLGISATGQGDEQPVPSEYFSRLTAAQAARNAWIKSALKLQKFENELKLLRSQLISDKPTMSKLHPILTEKLLALRDAKRTDLLQRWSSEDELEFILTLAGFHGPQSLNQSTIIDPLQLVNSKGTSDKVPAILPLPAAAAHHPSHLRKFRKSIFDASSSIIKKDTQSTSRSKATARSSSSVTDETRTHAVLKDALARAKSMETKLDQELVQITHSSRGTHRIHLDLWQADSDSEHCAIDFEARPDPQTFQDLLRRTKTRKSERPSNSASSRDSVIVDEDSISDDEVDFIASNRSGVFPSLMAASLSFDMDGSYMYD